MAGNKTEIYVYAHWVGMQIPELFGVLSAHQAKGRKAFSFEYDKNWLKSNEHHIIDPDIQFYAGSQFPDRKENFGIFLDSMPDTWGRTLLKRREAHTFFTKRFDRIGSERIHFSSAMTMTGNTEETLRDDPASYLDIVEFIQDNTSHVAENLAQLWRRIVFNIAVSNTDDHLRNHGFILHSEGWQLSPAYDLNPSIDKGGLALNIDMHNNALDFDLAKSVGEYFRLNEIRMNAIIQEVLESVKHWEKIAKEMGISRTEQELMASAFKV